MFNTPGLPAAIALYEFVVESHHRFDVADELTEIDDVVQVE